MPSTASILSNSVGFEKLVWWKNRIRISHVLLVIYSKVRVIYNEYSYILLTLLIMHGFISDVRELRIDVIIGDSIFGFPVLSVSTLLNGS